MGWKIIFGKVIADLIETPFSSTFNQRVDEITVVVSQAFQYFPIILKTLYNPIQTEPKRLELQYALMASGS